MISPRDFALNFIQNNPQIANNPQAQQYIKVIQDNDEQRGEEIARNLCKSYGVTPEQVLQSAKEMFHMPF